MSPANKFWIGVGIILFLFLFIKIPLMVIAVMFVYTIILTIAYIGVTISGEDPGDYLATKYSPHHLIALSIRKFNNYINNRYG